MPDPNIEGRILLALKALKNDPKLKLRRAAEIYEVGRMILWRRQRGIQPRQDWTPKSRKLSDPEEQIIAQFILDLDSRGFPPRLRGVEEMANRLLADRDASPVGKRWAFNFVKRHPDLKSYFNRQYYHRRSKCKDPAIIRDWFRLVENTITKYSINLADIYNFDDTCFMVGAITSGMVVMGTEKRGKADSVQAGNREWATAIQAINGEGWAIAPFIVVAGEHHLADLYQKGSLPTDWAIAMAHNGRADNDIILQWLKHFDRHTKAQSTGRYRLLILDGHDSNHSVDFEKYCEDNNIVTLCIPAHSSHLLQPLDVGCIGPLKQAYSREIEHLTRCSVTHVSKTDFFSAFHAAHEAAITESNIKGGFRGAGIIPLDPETVISKLDVQLRTPTPAEEDASLPNPWVSKTPERVPETTQSEYLEKSVRRHHSSSPSSTLEALKSFSKETKAIEDQIALLKSENQMLRQSNEALRKRRGAQRTRLQDRGEMIADEAREAIDQDEIDQEDIDAQIADELSRSGGQARSGQARQRRCGRCGKTGHNARTCEIVVEISGEEDSDSI
ncbi:Jerky protein-like protein-like [Ceratocystis lukuohia]|uniref:Jerky protein-like protein-like n=1 Tax=Ceratocystis lukuohia TaxID=2019550 RepID=A0ABR4MLH9_9PEZI